MIGVHGTKYLQYTFYNIQNLLQSRDKYYKKYYYTLYVCTPVAELVLALSVTFLLFYKLISSLLMYQFELYFKCILSPHEFQVCTFHVLSFVHHSDFELSFSLRQS